SSCHRDRLTRSNDLSRQTHSEVKDMRPSLAKACRHNPRKVSHQAKHKAKRSHNQGQFRQLLILKKHPAHARARASKRSALIRPLMATAVPFAPGTIFSLLFLSKMVPGTFLVPVWGLLLQQRV